MTIPTPALNADGSIDAVVVREVEPFGESALLTLHLPITLPSTPVSGRYFLARPCQSTLTEQVNPTPVYLRTALFASSYRTTQQADGMPVGEWQFLLPQNAHTPLPWLHEVSPTASINFLGPFGNGFQLNPLCQRLLIVADSARVATMFALIDEALDAGKRVAVVVQGATLESTLLSRLAIAVELHFAASQEEWEHKTQELLGWTDQLGIAVAPAIYTKLGAWVRQRRSRLDGGFAQVLVEANLLCGVGACLACVVPLSNQSMTRACAHGPVLDLRLLA